MGLSWVDNFVKNRRNLPISNPKPDLHNINAHTKFVKNPLIFTYSSYHPENMDGQTDVQQTDGHMDNQGETIILATIVWQYKINI